MFWKKKISPLNSHEFEELTKKMVAMVGDIDTINNTVAVLDGICKSNRARISKIKVEKILDEGEKDIKDEPRYL